MKKTIFLTVFIAFALMSFAQTTYTWNHTSGDRSWSLNANWTPEGVPTANDIAIVELYVGADGTDYPQVGAPGAVAAKLIIKGDPDSPWVPASVTVVSGGTLTVDSLHIEYFAGDAILKIETGGEMTVNTGVFNEGKIWVFGGTLTVNGDVDNNTFLADNAGKIEVTSGTFTLNGDLNFEAGTAIIESAGTFTVENIVKTTTGIATVDGDGTLTYLGDITVSAGELKVEGAMKYVAPPPPTTITSGTGKIWMDRNLGASQVATSSTDALAYGDYYQWGRLTDGHQIGTSGTTTTQSSGTDPGHGDFILTHQDWINPGNDNLWQGVNGTNNPCPSGFRLPTQAEWEAERLSWATPNAAGAIAAPIKLPLPGDRDLNSPGAISGVGQRAHIWSSTVSGVQIMQLNLYSSFSSVTGQPRAYGLTIRCIKDD